MQSSRKNYQSTLFFVTLLFFLLGIVHITFGLIAVICFSIPLIQYKYYKKKKWCQSYCPRAGFFTRVLSKISLHLKRPKWLTHKHTKKYVLAYFLINFTIIALSTVMVAIGRVEPILNVRFMMFFPLPFSLPQLLSIQLGDSLMHVGYRLYGMMMTSTLIGLSLGFLYMPRAWCSICPVSTLTTKKRAV